MTKEISEGLGEIMPKYLYTGSYSPGSWARLLRISDDRTEAARSLAESLGGSVDSVYWSVGSRSVYVIADMPDSEMAAAAIAVLTHTGAFQNVEADEVLSSQQFNAMLEVAGNAAEAFEVPGRALLTGDSSRSRFQPRS
jgi:uncharacterized protein with GYD domain